jgi:hypothetical protein
MKEKKKIHNYDLTATILYYVILFFVVGIPAVNIIL